MNPEKSSTVLKNEWYVLCPSEELAAGKTLGRIVASTPLVAYRRTGGEPTVLFDLCPHRRAPLSMGLVEGDNLRCVYHGMLFDSSGACIEIPSQDVIPPRAKVQPFPVTERYGFVWVWLGDPDRAETAALPGLTWREDPSWDHSIRQYFHVEAPHMLMNNNLLDLSHVAFLHRNSIGFDAGRLADDPLQVEVEERRITCRRHFPGVAQAPAHRAWYPMEGPVDRTQSKQWFAPSVISVLARNRNADVTIDLRADHFLTPETETSHHYHIALSRNFRVGDGELSRRLDADTRVVHGEDVEMAEAQQRMARWTPGRRDMGLKADVAVVAAHKVLARLAEEEQRTATPA